MDKYSRYYGLITFIVITLLALFIGYKLVVPTVQSVFEINSKVKQLEVTYEQKLAEKNTVERKLAQMRNAIKSANKKVYSPVDSDLGNDTLFFTLYKDVIEMVHSNSIKIKSM